MKIFAALFWVILLSACVKPGPVTFDEQQAYMVREQCAQSATEMTSGWPNSDNPYWNSYFVMCMRQFGIPDSVLNQMWY